MSVDTGARPSPTAAPSPSGFPRDFVWGAATAAYQVEGATRADGRTPSIWDTFAATPGRIRNGDSGEIAADHYRNYREDVALMSDLGLGAYRFSVSWSRVRPDGDSRVNRAGLDFYDRLVDTLLEANIDPWVTLYHWDLPEVLEQKGGWPHRDTAHRFAELAASVSSALGDRVTHWTTLNEPWCSAFLGYGSGRHAPGRTDPGDALAAAHHLLLGHGLAVEAIRSECQGAEVGITLNLYPVTPLDDRPGNLEAARRVDGLQNRWFLDPILRGSYPDDVLADMAPISDLSWLRDGDLDTISRPLDFLGVNYYTRQVVRAGAFPGVGDVEHERLVGPHTASGWYVDPDGLLEVLLRVSDYTDLPVFVTENGSAWHDEPDATGAVEDRERTAYLASHLLACQQALQQGVRLGGYFAWSLLDNFEWAEGYAVRFGLVYVDYETQRRTVKASGRWYADLIRAHGGTY